MHASVQFRYYTHVCIVSQGNIDLPNNGASAAQKGIVSLFRIRLYVGRVIKEMSAILVVADEIKFYWYVSNFTSTFQVYISDERLGQ